MRLLHVGSGLRPWRAGGLMAYIEDLMHEQVRRNAIGGIVDDAREGETGWLNRSLSPEELARIMLDLVARPNQVIELNARIRAARGSIVKPLRDHADEMDAIYGQLRDAEVVRG